MPKITGYAQYLRVRKRLIHGYTPHLTAAHRAGSTGAEIHTSVPYIIVHISRGVLNYIHNRGDNILHIPHQLAELSCGVPYKYITSTGKVGCGGKPPVTNGAVVN